MQKVCIAENQVTFHASPIKILPIFNNALLRYGDLFTRILGFRETFMRMSPACEGDFTTKLQL